MLTKAHDNRMRCAWLSPRRVAIAAFFAITIIALWLGRSSLLRGAADLWIVSDPLKRADAIVVLGGDFQERPAVAANLYQNGIADKILISKTGGGENGVLSYTDRTRTTLLNLGVPATAIETFGEDNKNTREEAVALRTWASGNGASALIIPDDFLGARRAQWIFRREFVHSTTNIFVFTFEPHGFNRHDLWKTERGLIAFRNEFVKYIYYRLKY
jgi:uncharacterized SAM-binding protein YcdF (DUF218 family)